MSPNAVFKKGNTAVITGGASGIGLALATKCAGYGMDVVIVDNNSSNLAGAKKFVKGHVETVQMDVAKSEDFEKLKLVGVQHRIKLGTFYPDRCDVIGSTDTQQTHITNTSAKIDLLVLNAGIGLNSDWSDTSYFHQVMDVNLFGVIHGLSTLLPLVTEKSTPSSPSSIIITGSKQGITNPPGNPAYNASKAAVKTLAEHLSFDLSKSSPTTSVHLLVPGWTFTGLSGNEPFAKNGKEKPDGAWSPEQVVDFLEDKMDEKKFYIICPDNDVSEETDRKRMLWTANDAVQGRPPLTRWRDEYSAEAEEWIKNGKI